MATISFSDGVRALSSLDFTVNESLLNPVQSLSSLSFEAPDFDFGTINPVTSNSSISFNSYVQPTQSAFIKWAKVSTMNFEKSIDNRSGKGPVEHPGEINDALKLNDGFVAYNENGASVLKPTQGTYSLKRFMYIGPGNKGAVTGTEDTHWMVDTAGHLWIIEDGSKKGIKDLGYEEYLSVMTNPILTYNNRDRVVHICDGTYGYVYDVDTGFFGKGPVNVTGYDYRDGQVLVTSPAAITIPAMLIELDAMDFGTPKRKDIYGIGVGSRRGADALVQVEFQFSNTDREGNFTSIGWQNIPHTGQLHRPCSGLFLKVNLKLTTQAAITIEKINIWGVVHGYSPLDVQLDVRN